MRFVGDAEHQLRHGVALEGQLAAGHLVEHHAQRKQVGTAVDLLAGQLLRRHVARRAEHHAGLGLRRVGNPRDAEVGHLDLVGIGFIHDIGRLDVAMHDIVFMGIGQGVGHARDDAHDARQGHQIALLGIGHQILALEELHRDVGQVMLLAGVIHLDDVGMVEPARRLFLAEETLLDLNQFIGFELLREGHGLDRDDTVDLRIPAQVDHTHGALAEFLLDLVAAQHGLLDIAAGIEQAGVRATAATAAENDGFGQLLGAIDAGLDVAELRVVIEDVTERRLGLVELALALKIQRQVVDVLHDLVILRAQAEFVEGHVELALPLEGQAEHAVGLRGGRVRLLLAALGDDEALDRKQQMPKEQQTRRHHQLQPH